MAGYVTRRTLTVVALVFASVIAISMGAATIGSTISQTSTEPVISPPGGGQNGSLPGSPGGGEGEVRSDTRSNQTTGLRFESCVSFLTGIPGTVLYFGVFFGFLYMVKRRYSFGSALLASYGLAPLAFLAYFVTTSGCATTGGQGVGSATSGSGGIPGSGTALSPPDFSPLVLMGVLGVIFVAMAAVLFSASGDQVAVEDEEDEKDDSGVNVQDFAAAAGEAADRLEKHNANVDNEVYRAWWEMTNLLDVSAPDSTTPREFADAAVELGIDRDDINELTRLFEEVRYGRRDPESREELAIRVFRRIESEYGEETHVEFGNEIESSNASDTNESKYPHSGEPETTDETDDMEEK